MGLGNLVAAISTDDRDNNCVLLYRAPYEETHYSAAIRETEVAGGKTQREAMRTLAMRLRELAGAIDRLALNRPL